MTSVAIYHLFQSTPLCEGRLRHVLGRIRAEGVSIHSPLRGETLRADHTARIAWFQSTPLCEGRPDLVKVVIPAKRVSIHSPLRGETQLQVVCQTASTCFNPLPSARGDTTPSLSSQFPQSFNPLPSARGEETLMEWICQIPQACFNPLPSARGDIPYGVCITVGCVFQSTPLCEGRRCDIIAVCGAEYVSIHSPLRGETDAHRFRQLIEDVSIHSPLRGETQRQAYPVSFRKVSIHSPLRGETY